MSDDAEAEVQLTAAQFLPFVVAAGDYDTFNADWRQRLFRRWPPCPTCHQPVTEVGIDSDLSFTEDLVHMRLRPCGHRHTISGDTVFEAGEQARRLDGAGSFGGAP